MSKQRLIDAIALKESLQEWIEKSENMVDADENTIQAYRDVLTLIDGTPTEKIGKWKHDKRLSILMCENWYICSNCGISQTEKWAGEYCPCCGTRMMEKD